MISKETTAGMFRRREILTQPHGATMGNPFLPKLSEKQIAHFQRDLEGRAKRLDKQGKLDGYYIEYLYHPDFNFGKLFRKGTDFAIVEAFLEAYSNVGGTKTTLLIFSRPRDNIYVAVADPPCCPFPGLWFDDVDGGSFMISTLESFLKEV